MFGGVYCESEKWAKGMNMEIIKNDEDSVIIRLTVNGQEVDLDPNILYFDMDNIESVMSEQAVWQAYWDQLLQFKSAEVDRVKLVEEANQARIALDVRVDVTNNPTSFGLPEKTRVTESIIDSCVKIQQSYLDSVHRVISVKEELGVLRSIVDGFKSRSVLVATAGGRRRDELASHMNSNVRKVRNAMSQVKDQSNFEFDQTLEDMAKMAADEIQAIMNEGRGE